MQVRAVGTVFANNARSIPALRRGDRADLEPEVAFQLVKVGLAKVIKRDRPA